MQKEQQFDVLKQNIDQGLFLIEASAGTGKTFNIQHIYLRLILEKGLQVDNILVVTFTEAATAELRTRIRANLTEAHEWFRNERFRKALSGPSDENPDILSQILSNVINEPKFGCDIETAERRLRLAIVSFDEAAIFTIHGFCSRMLSENAFESGILFNTELVTDDSIIVQEVIDDFWRRTFYDKSETFARIVKSAKFGPDKMLEFAKMVLKKPNVEIYIPEDFSTLDETQLENSLTKLLNQLKEKAEKTLQYWIEVKDEIENVMFENTPLKRNSYKSENFEDYSLKLCMALKSFPFNTDISGIKKFSSMEIKNQKKKDCVPPTHDFFNICDELCQDHEKLNNMNWKYMFMLKIKLHRFLLQERAVSLRKQLSGIQSFDDMLIDMRNALRNENGQCDQESSLAKRIREKYHAALIDEFQDTDPVQYEIFDTIFNYPEYLFFMIGDPKQSIYEFRGADIFSYLDVSESLKNVGSGAKMTLTNNFRSRKELLSAFNNLFDVKNPFVYEEIPYEEMNAGKDPDKKLFINGIEDQKPFKLWTIGTEDGEAIKKPDAREKVFTAVSAKIAEILNGVDAVNSTGNYFEILNPEPDQRQSEPVKPGDIAILVTINSQAAQMQEYLSQRGIPSVIQSSGNIFASFEAMEMWHILHALSEPNNANALKTALALPIIGLNAERIDQFNQIDSETDNPLESAYSQFINDEFDYWHELFTKYNREWTKKGFIQMFSSFINPEQPEQEFNVEFSEWVLTDKGKKFKSLCDENDKVRKDIRANLLSLPNGERQLTNIMHLVELIHQATIEKQLGPSGILTWLQERISEANETKEEHEIRLERDSDAVRIMTVHKSKGLEFPIVFCPFMWHRNATPNNDKKNAEYSFHHKPEGAEKYTNYLAVDELTIENFKQKRNHEALAELLRLLYVAVTRSVHLCYLTWGNINMTNNTSLHYLQSQSMGGSDESETSEVTVDVSEESSPLSTPEENEDPSWLGAEETIEKISIDRDIDENSHFKPVQDHTALNKRDFTGKVPCNWGIMSYSTLGGHGDTFVHAHQDDISDPRHTRDLNPEPKPLFSDFPGGYITGNCIHEIFEKLDFTLTHGKNIADWSEMPEIKGLIEKKFAKFGRVNGRKGSDTYNENLKERYSQVCEMLHKVMNVNLTADIPNLILNMIPNEKRLTEMDFFFPVENEINFNILNKLLRSRGLKGMSDEQEFKDILDKYRISFKSPVGARKGFMNGLIDLIFEHEGIYYFLDWKTTDLGDYYTSYSKQNLMKNMLDTSYILQYYIYALAVHKMLIKQFGENYDYTCFGGGFYVYVRGVNGENPDTGIFYQHQDLDFMKRLENVFGGNC